MGLLNRTAMSRSAAGNVRRLAGAAYSHRPKRLLSLKAVVSLATAVIGLSSQATGAAIRVRICPKGQERDELL